MIVDKTSYKNYLEADRIALNYSRKRPRFYSDDIWKFERTLRLLEYKTNTAKTIFQKLECALIRYYFNRKSMKLGFSIPINVFGPGLSIAHYGTIVVNGKARVGANCRIQTCVVIGGKTGSEQYPRIGDNCYIGSGAKIIGDVELGNNVRIGANAVVTKSFGDNVTLVGVPAKIIQKSSEEEMDG